ncbi:MAG: methyltransferase [Alphaproteobacteria bacterium]|nr:methyltransferase [Alphaproteobacteria bacterium]
MNEGVMIKAWIKAILILQGTALILVPSLILWEMSGTAFAAAPAGPSVARFWPGLLAAAVGFSLIGWTLRDFARIGKGTPAPWDPAKALVVRCPYRHVRNPMITGVIAVLLAESLVIGSWGIAAWLAVFVTANLIYIANWEEPALMKRFDEDYRLYKASVRRWIPAVRPWQGAGGEADG